VPLMIELPKYILSWMDVNIGVIGFSGMIAARVGPAIVVASGALGVVCALGVVRVGAVRGSFGAVRGSFGAVRGSLGAVRGSLGGDRGSLGGDRGSLGTVLVVVGAHRESSTLSSVSLDAKSTTSPGVDKSTT
jgi:hypothetical protein